MLASLNFGVCASSFTSQVAVESCSADSLSVSSLLDSPEQANMQFVVGVSRSGSDQPFKTVVEWCVNTWHQVGSRWVHSVSDTRGKLM